MTSRSSSTALVFDIETAPLPGVESFLPVVKAPSNYKDSQKIEEYITEKTAQLIEEAGLDPDLCRIAVIGASSDGENVFGFTCRDEDEERSALIEFWKQVDQPGMPLAHLVGYNCLGFDLCVLLRRSQYLGVKAPPISFRKYDNPHMTDLMQALSFNGLQTYRSLGFYLKRFGIPHDDTITGKEVAALIRNNQYSVVWDHCRADVLGTYALARRIGVV